MIHRISLLISVWCLSALGAAAPLPKDIKWITNDTDPTYASKDAVKGGTYNGIMTEFPLTLRRVGPDSNGSFRARLDNNAYSLITRHPNTENLLPSLATHWAYDKDGRTMYFKLNPAARWSDGKPVVAEDYSFTLEFMRSQHIVAPWYNEYYSKQIDKVTVYDKHTIAISATKPKPDLEDTVSLEPKPRHFYKKIDKGFVKKYNWKVVPNTGPYQISKVRKGKSITFSRKKNWWGNNLKYHVGRHNVDRVVYKVVRDFNVNFAYFRKAKSEFFSYTFPKYWHDRSDIKEIKNGYIVRSWIYNDTRQPMMGVFLNTKVKPLDDQNVRLGIAHALDFDGMIKKVLRGDYERLPQAYTGYAAYTNTSIKARTFSLAKADEYFKKAGWSQRGPDGIRVKNGKRLSFKVNYSFNGHTPRLVYLKEQAKKAGLDLTIQLLDGSADWKRNLEKKHEIAWSAFSTKWRPAYWGLWHSVNADKKQTNNFTATKDKDLDKWIDAYRASLDRKERIALSMKIQQRLHERSEFIPSYMVPYHRTAYWRWWRFPKVMATKHSAVLFEVFGASAGGRFWLDKQMKQETLAAMKSGKTFKPVTINDKAFRR